MMVMMMAKRITRMMWEMVTGALKGGTKRSIMGADCTPLHHQAGDDDGDDDGDEDDHDDNDDEDQFDLGHSCSTIHSCFQMFHINTSSYRVVLDERSDMQKLELYYCFYGGATHMMI